MHAEAAIGADMMHETDVGMQLHVLVLVGRICSMPLANLQHDLGYIAT